MTDDNSKPNELVDMDLDDFADEFFQTKKEEPKDEVTDESDENEDDPLAAEEDTDAPAETGDEDEEQDDENSEDESEEDEDEEEEKPAPKPKSKAQQRIEKLLERERLANERATALEARLAALEAQKPKEEKHEEAPALRDQLPEGAPNPDAVDEKGNPVYPLGEFDKNYIRDITKFTIAAELQAKQVREQQEAAAREVAEQQAEIQKNWHERLEAFEEEAPDVRDSISDLVGTFQNVDPAYGEYLATVIMQSESGPQIMYYLSQNIGEAQKIVASGPAAATLALGRLEARLSTKRDPKEEKRNIKRVSSAPKPPEARTRGSAGKFSVSPDTDDLDAFEREFFKKK